MIKLTGNKLYFPVRRFSSGLLQRIKSGLLDDQNPYDIIKDTTEPIDAASYDILFDRFFSGDWGANKTKNQLKVVNTICDFIKLTDERQVELSNDQVLRYALQVYHRNLITIITPYQRIEQLSAIARLEQRTCRALNVPFLDELEEVYVEEVDNFLWDIVINVESSRAIRNVMDMLRIANYLPKQGFFDKAISAYMIAVEGQLKFDVIENEFQIEKTVQAASDTGVVLQCMSHFNADNPLLVKLMGQQIKPVLELLQKGSITRDDLLVSAKFSLMRYLKHTALFPEHQSELSKQTVSCLFKHLSSKLGLEDFNQLAQVLRLHKANCELVDRVTNLNKKVDQLSGKETTVSKFQQEVFQTVRQLEGTCARFECQKFGIDKDIVLTQFNGQQLAQELPIEVNGVFHYARNSEQMLGRDRLKQLALKSLGYKDPGSLIIPYYDWVIVEQANRKPFLEHTIANALL